MSWFEIGMIYNMSCIEEKDRQITMECSAQLEKMHRHIAEVCDREARKSIREWYCRCRAIRKVERSRRDHRNNARV